ncbi:uncharacterized protein LOC121376415 [Gigantopelta aegis]|uniref:uncharacterized protein LOC121376415 n=1 Tax=Gigantopelta aegis TaxID=1735272 RepID=UPI001B88ADD8|nr:uncharacterized protein LOC121376415 [Gigantopelta aegis]
MNGSATSRPERNMTIDTFEIDDFQRKGNGSGTSSPDDDVRNETGLTHHKHFAETIMAQTSKSKSTINGLGRVAPRNKTSGFGKVGKGCRVEKKKKKKLEKCRSMEMSHVHLVYSQMAPHLHGIRHKAWPRVKQFLKGLQPGSIVADIGCGSGRYLHINKSLYKLGSDICIPLVQYAKEKGHEVMVADNLMLPYRHDVFDAVVSVGVIHHFSSYERRVQALKELTRVLRPGGRLLVCVWAFEQKHRKFECQDVLIPWCKPQQSDLQRVRGSCSDFERSSTSSISDDDTSSISSSLSIDSFQESSSTSYNMLQNDEENKNLVQECRRVEACMKKLSLKPQDYQKDELNLNSAVISNGYSNRPESTASRPIGLITNLKSVQTNQDDTVPMTTWHTKVTPWNQQSCYGDAKTAHEGSNCLAGLVTTESCFQQCSEFDNRMITGSAFNQVPDILPCRTLSSEVGSLCAHASKLSLKLQTETFHTSVSRDNGKHNENVKTGVLQKLKVAFHNLFSSHHHARDSKDFRGFDQISDQDVGYSNFPQGFQVREFPQSSLEVREFPQSSLGVGSKWLSDSNVFGRRHQEPCGLSKDHRSSSLTAIQSCIDKQGNKDSCKPMYTNGFSNGDGILSQGEYKTGHQDEHNLVFKKENSFDKDLDDDVFDDASAVKNGIHTNHEPSFSHTSNDEMLEMNLPFKLEDEEMKNLDHLEVSFINSELSRYYHVFREGELKQLVSENIKDLVIVDTYFDHANWCLVAEKISSV